MSHRHPVYNFHTGFWASLLISLVIIIQSGLFLMGAYSLGSAQTQFVNISKPTEGQQFASNDSITLEAITQQGIFTPALFTVTNLDTTNKFEITGQSSDLTTWTGVFNPLGASGLHEVTVVVTDPSGNQQSAGPVQFQVGQQALTVDISEPTDATTITGPVNFIANTNIAADGVVFDLVSPDGQTSNFDATPDANKKVWTHNFDPTGLNNGDYTLVANATLQTQRVQSSTVSLIINNQVTQATVNILNPANNSTVQDSIVLRARVSETAESVSFQFTGSDGQTFGANAQVENANDWAVPAFDTTQMPNGTYSLIATAIVGGQAVISQNFGITVENAILPTVPPSITTTALTEGVQDVPYSFALIATGGTPPISWAITQGALPSGLTLNGTTGAIIGTPAESGSFSFTVKATDTAGLSSQEKTFTLVINTPPLDGTTSPDQQGTTPPDGGDTTTPTEDTTVQPTEQPNLLITDPQANDVLAGTNLFIVMKSNVPINQPSFLMTDQTGSNVIPTTSKPFLPINNDGSRIWHFLLDSTKFDNGPYTLRANATTKEDNSTVAALPVQVSINNPTAEDQVTTTSGRITAPKPGQGLSGNVLLRAEVQGDAQSLVFKVTSVDGKTQTIAGLFNSSRNAWEAVWNSSGAPAGTVTARAELTTADGQLIQLPRVDFTLIAQTVSLEEEPPPPPPEPELREIVEPEVVDTITRTGPAADLPVECTSRNITTRQECDDYLASRRILVLDEAEQEKARTDLPEFLTRHVVVGEGRAVARDVAPRVQRQAEKQVEDPLSEIIPVDKRKVRDVVVQVKTSTEPPESIKPFVEQTVPAVLIFDKDGDGLSDEGEERYGTDPNNPDSDGDGFDDGTEVKNGFNPLGSGRLTRQVAPVDQALLNNRPLDQPKFAGRIEEESIKVNEAVTSEEPQPDPSVKPLRLSGLAEPNSFVTLYIYSSLPIVVTVQADQSGNWQYELTHPLVDGRHDVYATVTNDTGKIVKKSKPFSFFVQEAQAMSEDEFLMASISVTDTSSTFLAYYLGGGLVIIMIGGGFFFYYIRQKKTFG